MSKLIAFSGDYQVKEYFPNAYKPSYDKRWNLKAEEEYPFLCHAHADVCDARLLKDIRLYIERCGKDDVFYSRVAKSYSYCYNLKAAKHTWDESWDRVTNDWFTFYFGAEEDRTLLMLKHSDLTMETTEFHPEYNWHTTENTRSW
jgi:hypothetical protein